MDGETERLEAWERRLRLAEQDLQEREQKALAGEPSPRELLAFATERDRIALDRDRIATSYDGRASDRDRMGLGRDAAAVGRDRRARELAEDRDVAFPDRWFAATDRDDGAGDRGDSYVDRTRSSDARDRAAEDRTQAADDRDQAAEKASQQDRELQGLRTALESRTVIGQAQGLLMARHRVTPDAAFALLTRLSQHSNIKLQEVAAYLVETAEVDG